MKIIISVHPRTKKKIIENNIQLANNVILHEPFGLFDFIKLQKNAYCVVSDSGTISEESAILGIPTVSFRFCTERPEAIDKGNTIISNLDPTHLLDAIKITVSFDHSKTIIPIDYIDNNISDKIIKVIVSYTPVINRVIWRK